jgi:hypothetical protein
MKKMVDVMTMSCSLCGLEMMREMSFDGDKEEAEPSLWQ